jgi:hypothetical protein
VGGRPGRLGAGIVKGAALTRLESAVEYKFSDGALKGEDELKSAAYGAAEVFNAYVRRRWPR